MPSIKRLLFPSDDHFFLFGPRGVGKSTWLKQNYRKAYILSLLDQDLFLELSTRPSKIRDLVRTQVPPGGWVCVDEIQKLPSLLDEVHLLMEDDRNRFALTGSSARKLKRGGADLLAARAISKALTPFVSKELGRKFDLDTALKWGGLPLVWTKPQRRREILRTYVSSYLKEEVLEERLIRKVEPFSRFIQVAGQFNGQVLNFENVSREAKVPQSTIQNYFEILEDTLLIHKLLPYSPGLRVREQESPKYYWFDTGVARAAAGLLSDDLDPMMKGFLLETWIHHELKTYIQVHSKDWNLFYYKTHHQDEIDFIIETRPKSLSHKARVMAIEVKSADYVDGRWLDFMNRFNETKKLDLKGSFLVYRGSKDFLHPSGVQILSVDSFLKKLWAHELASGE